MRDNYIRCPKCEGKRVIVITKYLDGEIYGVIRQCDECFGEGEIPDPEW